MSGLGLGRLWIFIAAAVAAHQTWHAKLLFCGFPRRTYNRPGQKACTDWRDVRVTSRAIITELSLDDFNHCSPADLIDGRVLGSSTAGASSGAFDSDTLPVYQKLGLACSTGDATFVLLVSIILRRIPFPWFPLR